MKLRYPFDSLQDLINKVKALYAEHEEAPRELADNLSAVLYEVGHDRLALDDLLLARKVTGWCPMGCGSTLSLAARGAIECADAACPEPRAVTKLLLDAEHHHLVTFAKDCFQAKHPLRERLNNELLTCKIGDAARIMKRSRVPLDATYRVMPSPIGPGGWGWERLDDDF